MTTEEHFKYLINFGKNFQDLLDDLSNCDKIIDINDNVALFNFFKYLNYFRHNVIQKIILKNLGFDWQEEQKIGDFILEKYNFKMIDNYYYKTPDILFLRDEILIICDVSISSDVALQKKRKLNKYGVISDYLSLNNIKNKFLHVNIDIDNRNIYKELNKLNDYYINKDIDITFYNRCVRIIEDKKQWVSMNIDKEFFELMKKREFESITENDSNLKQEFLNALKHEDYGIYKDLDVNLENFRNYNKKFNIEDEILKNEINFNEDDLCAQLKEILEDCSNCLNKKYKDILLNEKQFVNAKKNIYSEMELRPKLKYPKPTHHILLPILEEDLSFDKEDVRDIKLEQKLINDFAVDFLINYKEMIIDKDSDDKLPFIKKIIENHNYTLNESSNKKINNDIYEGNDFFKKIRSKYDKFRNRYYLFGLEMRKRKVRNYNHIEDVGLKYRLKKSNILKSNYFFEKTDLESYEKERLIFVEKYESLINSKNRSFRKFLEFKGLFKEEKNESYYKQPKMLKIFAARMDSEFNECIKKAGIKKEFKVNNLSNEKDSKWETINFDYIKNFELFLQKLSTPIKQESRYTEEDFLLNEKYIGVDDVKINDLKIESIKNYAPYYLELKNTHAYRYSRNLNILMSELMHIETYNAKNDHFALINGGIKNFLMVVIITYTGNNEANGKPFLSIIKTKNPEFYNTGIFGKTYTKKIDDKWYYVYTNWRRLSMAKVTYCRDVFYSTLSSTMNSVMSSPKPFEYLNTNKLRDIYTLRIVIGYATSQRLGEILMDTRYTFMSSFSHYTNIEKLITEKYKPPYKTIFETWIVNKILEKLPIINQESKMGNIIQNKIVMDSEIRDVSTIGGHLNITSLWYNHKIIDITELLDEAFIYVHTMKEPSNLYHEQVKAIRTIVKFQEEFNGFSDSEKNGIIKSNNDRYNYLMKATNIGCDTNIIIQSVKHTIEMESPFFKKIINDVNNESISELLSTKAIISNEDREILIVKEDNNREINKKNRRVEKIKKIENISTSEKEKHIHEKIIMYGNTEFYNKHKIRQKVMETVLSVICKNNIEKTVQLADLFIKNNGKVIADICIKSQYGSKREFYVVNLGAKALARVTENIFKEICKNSPNEAISIGGDKKIVTMQRMLDKMYRPDIGTDYKIMYVNGDCTKWSACETMASFIAMIVGLKSKIPVNAYQLLLATYNSWSDKHIQIPIPVLNKVCPTKDTQYLNKEEVRKKSLYHSTQNFLQGMFNYSSSYKAVCCSNYTKKIWSKIYPDSKLLVEHLEHSDDYEFIILYTNKQEFEKFRILQKIMMRLHGINDSERKTSCQPYFMEFVSQIAFNGTMVYPQIKKSKEINLSLPCTGYVQDIDSALSRVGECSRVGCNQSFLYFFQRLHVYLVAKTYSILPKMTNNMNRTMKELFNEPIQLFGIPDMLPIFSLYCKGNGNNYRLYNYGNVNIKNLIIFLYMKAKAQLDETDYINDDIDYRYSLYSPNFVYELKNRTVNKLRSKLNVEMEEIKQFWEKNLSYKLMKPKTRTDLIMWIKCMFYNKNFLEAYTKCSRTYMTMRLSGYVNKKIIKDIVLIKDYEDKYTLEKNLMTIKEFYKNTKEEFYNALNTRLLRLDDENNISLLKILTKCDPNYSAIYAAFSKIVIIDILRNKDRTIQIVHKMPPKFSSYHLTNNVSTILQYLYDKENFFKDKRYIKSYESLMEDITIIKERINPKILQSRETMAILSVFNDLKVNEKTDTIMFDYNRYNCNPIDCALDSYKFNFRPGCVLKIDFNELLKILDPSTGQVLYTKGNRLTKDYHRQCIDDIMIMYTVLKICEETTMDIIDDFFNKLLFKNPLNTNTGIKAKEILKTITSDYIKIHNYNLDEIKIVGFLKCILLGDNEILDDFVNSIYSFSYSYDKKDQPISGKYLNETIVQFTYFKQRYKVYYYPKIINQPILLINSSNYNLLNILYNISIKLTIGTPTPIFEKNINNNNIKPINLEDRDNLYNYMKYKKITHYLSTDDTNNYKFERIEYIHNANVIYPIFITTMRMPLGLENKIRGVNVRPIALPKTMTVKLGKSKLYTVPYYKCRQSNNMYLEKDIYKDNINLNFFLKDSRAYRYMRNNLNVDEDKISFKRLSLIEEKKLLEKTIKNRRIYDFKLKDITTKKFQDEYWNLLLNESRTEKLNYDKMYEIRKDELVAVKKEKTYSSLFNEEVENEYNQLLEKKKKQVEANIVKNNEVPLEKEEYFEEQDDEEMLFYGQNEMEDEILDFDNYDINMPLTFEGKENYNKIEKKSEVYGENNNNLETTDNIKTNVVETLKQMAQNFEFDVGEIIDEKEYYTTLDLNLEEEPNLDFYIQEERQYKTKDELFDSIPNFEVSISDIFVSGFKIKKKKKVEDELGYLILKLMYKEPLYVTQLKYNYGLNNDYIYSDIENFIITMERLIELENNFYSKDIIFIYLQVVKLWTETFLIKPELKKKFRSFIVDQNEIKYYTAEKEERVTLKILEGLKLKNKYIGTENIYDQTYVIFECKREYFIQKYKNNVNKCYESMIKLIESSEIDRLTKLLESDDNDEITENDF